MSDFLLILAFSELFGFSVAQLDSTAKWWLVYGARVPGANFPVLKAIRPLEDKISKLYIEGKFRFLTEIVQLLTYISIFSLNLSSLSDSGPII